MGMKTLKTLRILIPGVMILIILLAFRENDLRSFADTIIGISFSKESVLFYVIPFILGTFYCVINIRQVFFRKPVNKVVNNIKTRLSSPFTNHSELNIHVDQLRKNDQLKQIFYRFIDSVPDLKVKSDNVRLNGLIMSSMADGAILSLIAIPLYVAFYLWKGSSYYFILAGICFAIFFVFRFLLLPLTLKRHIEYSDEQIDSIIANHYDELEQALIKLTQQKDGK